MGETENFERPEEIKNFSELAQEWWDPAGKFRPLHKFNPVRLDYIKQQACRFLDRDMQSPSAFNGLKLLDIGCGGGLLCEPLKRLGADIVGIDLSERNIEIAREHAAQSGLNIDYRTAGVNDLLSEEERFDIVLAMEVIEHVADPQGFIRNCVKLAKPGGLIFFATINRTLKAFALAIVGAEYILRWLPRGTHHYDQLVKPSEISAALAGADTQLFAQTGVIYLPLVDKWIASKDMSVNYMMVFETHKK